MEMPPFSLSYIGRLVIVNRIVAKTLDLAVPPTMLALADEVIKVACSISTCYRRADAAAATL
jgi:hypothetical protein